MCVFDVFLQLHGARLIRDGHDHQFGVSRSGRTPNEFESKFEHVLVGTQVSGDVISFVKVVAQGGETLDKLVGGVSTDFLDQFVKTDTKSLETLRSLGEEFGQASVEVFLVRVMRRCDERDVQAQQQRATEQNAITMANLNRLASNRASVTNNAAALNGIGVKLDGELFVVLVGNLSKLGEHTKSGDDNVAFVLVVANASESVSSIVTDRLDEVDEIA